MPPRRPLIPRELTTAVVRLGAREVRLTNLQKLFWPALGITKGALLQYYVDIAPTLLPHLRDRPMVMRRYPDGAGQPFFFMKQVPHPHPSWLETCAIPHRDGNVVAFPLIQDLPALLWVVNLGCIDLNPWYSRCDAPDQPDVLHFDLDPVAGTAFDRVRDAALVVHDALTTLRLPSYAKTTGSRGIHVYVPIRRGPTQHQVWQFAKALAVELAARHRELLTTEYSVARRASRGWGEQGAGTSDKRMLGKLGRLSYLRTQGEGDQIARGTPLSSGSRTASFW